MTKMMFRAALLAGALSVPMAATTSAQPPVVIGAGNLVNVQVGEIEVLQGGIIIEDVLRDINVPIQAAINIAANVCGVSVAAVAEIVEAGNDYSCNTGTQTGDQFVDITQ